MSDPVFGQTALGETDLDGTRYWQGFQIIPSLTTYGRPLAEARQDWHVNSPEDGVAKRRFLSDGAVPIRVRDDDGEGPTAGQARALHTLAENESAVVAAVLAVAYESYRAAFDQGWWTEADVPDPSGLQPHLLPTGITVARRESDGCSFLGFSFESSWEDDHGLTVVYHPSEGASWEDLEDDPSPEEGANDEEDD